jgi:ADP-heptose:LPS heptosyltransferase
VAFLNLSPKGKGKLKHFLRKLILVVIRIFGASGVRSASTTFSDTPRILLVRPDHLGDLLMTTPVLHAIKQHAPNSHITMMVGPWSSEVIARHTDIDRILTCPFPGFQRAAQKALAPYIVLFNTAKQLQRGHFDVAINLRPDFWWGATLLYLARIPRRIGYALEPGKPFLTHALPFQSPENAAISNLRLASATLQSIGYPPLDEPYTPERYPLHFTPITDEQQWATALLQNEGILPLYIVEAGLTPALENRAPLIVIHPGSGAAVKLWRTEGWAICADALTKSLTLATPVRIMLTGSKNERPMLEEIASNMQSPAVLVTDATIGQLAALQARALLVLSVDSGPLHLAVSQDTPTVQLFGPTDPRIFGPWGIRERHIVVASTHRCPTCTAIPCGRLDIPPQEVADHPCVRLITEQQVLAAVEKLLPYLKHEIKINATNIRTTAPP